MKQIFYSAIGLLVLLSSCHSDENTADAYGNFESDEIVISSEASGKLLDFTVEEGMQLKKDTKVGQIDDAILHIKKKQLEARQKDVKTKTTDVSTQIAVLQEQKKAALKNKARIENMLKDSAATEKQLDDMVAQINILDKQMESIRVKNSSVNLNVEAVEEQINELNLMIEKCEIVNPIAGTVLQTYASRHEITGAGRPLYKIADLSSLTLRAFISGDQLTSVKIGEEVTVIVDKNEGEITELKGKITWISANAEFTPKIIQTRKERVNLVYAMKVKVPNDGSLKIGMPGEVVFKGMEKTE